MNNKKNFFSVKVGIKPSKIFKGYVGVFALRDIGRGEIFGRVDTPEDVISISSKEFQKFDKITQARILEFCPLDNGAHIVPKDFNNMGTSWYHNHSCNPNSGFDEKGNHVAMRKIKKGEEIFYDYGMLFDDPKFKMKCRCKSKNCRKVITGLDWLDPSFQKEYVGYIWPWMKRPKNLGINS